MTAGWTDLRTELDQWAAAGRMADFWWRDDDAVTVTPALEQLLALQATTGAPLALAIIPAQAEAALAKRIGELPSVVALQHGFTHQNHVAPPAKKSEFPVSRALALRMDDLRAGQARMQQHFANRLLPVLVPPWNRIGDDILPLLPDLGFRAVSGFKPRPSDWAANGLLWLNTQVDPIDWHGNNNAAAAALSLGMACATLRAIRTGELPPQPVGLLTHHLRHDQTIWDFVAGFFKATRHPAVRWIDAATALTAGQSAPVMPS